MASAVKGVTTTGCTARAGRLQRARAPGLVAAHRASVSSSRHLGACHAFAAGPESYAYAGLGLAAASFVATFGIIPRYKESFKEGTSWNDIYQELCSSGGVPSMSPSKAYDLCTCRGGRAQLLDVRLLDMHQQGSAEAAVSAPLYQPIQGWDLPSNLRRLGFAFFGLAGTELNTDFLAAVQAAVPDKGTQLVLLCENGGSLENKSGTQFGFQSRSLKAAYYLRQAGYSKISYVAGGIRQWAADGLPLVAQESGADEEGQAVKSGA